MPPPRRQHRPSWLTAILIALGALVLGLMVGLLVPLDGRQEPPAEVEEVLYGQWVSVVVEADGGEADVRVLQPERAVCPKSICNTPPGYNRVMAFGIRLENTGTKDIDFGRADFRVSIPGEPNAGHGRWAKDFQAANELGEHVVLFPGQTRDVTVTMAVVSDKPLTFELLKYPHSSVAVYRWR